MAKKGKYTYVWPRPMVTVDAIIFSLRKDKPKVLLIQRGNNPFKGLWAIPGGFVDMDEELDTAVARELAEETGLTDIKLQQMHTFGTPGRDPRGRNITIEYMGFADESAKIKAGDDAAQAKWFDINKLPTLAFDHADVLTMAIAKLKRTKRSWFKSSWF